MPVIREMDIELKGDNNETFIGRLTIETIPVLPANGTAGGDQKTPEGVEPDPVGASSYVIAVVLIYGLSIVFLIGSHVIIKKRELHRDNEKQINKFLDMAPRLQEKSAKDSYKNLKHSIIPVVALSPARDLVTRRKSFAQLIHGLVPPSRRGSQERRNSKELSSSHLVPPDEQLASSKEASPQRSPRMTPRRVGDEEECRMPVIEEESESELDRSQTGSFKDKLRGARHKTSPAVSEVIEEHDPSEMRSISSLDNSDHGSESDKHKPTFYVGDTSSGSSMSASNSLPGNNRYSPADKSPHRGRSDSYPKYKPDTASRSHIWSVPQSRSPMRPPRVQVHSLPLIHGSRDQGNNSLHPHRDKEGSPDTQQSAESHSSSDTDRLLQVTCV